MVETLFPINHVRKIAFLFSGRKCSWTKAFLVNRCWIYENIQNILEKYIRNILDGYSRSNKLIRFLFSELSLLIDAGFICERDAALMWLLLAAMVLLLLFLMYRMLQCSRISIHKNLVLSFILRLLVVIVIFEPFISESRISSKSYREYVSDRSSLTRNNNN